jgi:hypothetical protein
MTICLAALCRHDDHQPAADRMVTMGGFIEFEHPVPKMAEPSPLAVVMVAGDTLVGTRLAQDVSGGLHGTSARILDIAQRLAAQYQGMRQQAIESQILGPRGLNLAAFYGAHASLNPQITMMLDQQLSQFNLGVELLLAGVDDQGPHIFSVHNPGPSELQHDVIGYAAIGSGAIHAVQSMIGFGHSAAAGVPETIFRVYASKRRAEVAPGVGQDTGPGDHLSERHRLAELRAARHSGQPLRGGSDSCSHRSGRQAGRIGLEWSSDGGWYGCPRRRRCRMKSPLLGRS